MALSKISRRFFGTALFPIRPICNNTSRQVRIFKGIRGFKCNNLLPTNRPAIRFRKGNYRRVHESSYSLEKSCFHHKPFPAMPQQGNYRRIYESSYPPQKPCVWPRTYPAMPQQLMDEFRLNGCFLPIPKNSNLPIITQKPIAPFVRSWKKSMQSKDIVYPATNNDALEKAPGGGIENLNGTRYLNPPRYVIPVAKKSSYSSMTKKYILPFIGSLRQYAQTKEPGSPAPGKGGPVSSSGGGVGKLDAANERGFFHQTNKSKLEQIKQMLKKKAMLKGTEDAGKPDPK